MAYIDNINALLPDNGVQQITAHDLRMSFYEVSDNVGRLGKVTENFKTGYRLYDETETYANTGDTGEAAVDVSYHASSSVLNGALGDYSFTAGIGTRTSATAQGCASIGSYNIGSSTSVFEVGIGTDDTNRLNALEVKNTGEVIAPDLTLDKISGGSNNILATKEYVDSMTFATGTLGQVSGDLQTAFVFNVAAKSVQVFGDGIKHSISDPNNQLSSITILTLEDDGVDQVIVQFSIGQAEGTYIEILYFN